MTVHVPKWLALAVAFALIAGAAFLLGRSSGHSSEPAGSAGVRHAEAEALKGATCSKAAAESATVDSEFDDSIQRHIETQSALEGRQTEKTELSFFTSDIVDFEVGILRCGDLTGDGIDEMVVGLSAGAAGRIFNWAIFTPNSNGRWRLAFDREDSGVASISLRQDSVLVRTPTFGRGDALCCPSGFKLTRILFRDGHFRPAIEPAPGERTIAVAEGRVLGIGSFQTAYGSPAEALAVFGTPTSIVSPSDVSCQFTWSDLGLAITFANFGGGEACGRDGRVGSVDLVGAPAEQAGWEITDGTRVGVSVVKLRQLHPGARQQGSELVLLETPSPYGGGGTTPTTTAYLVDGRTMALRFYVGAAGE